MSSELAAILLSAGTSSRMGDFKPLLPLGGKPLLAQVIETARRAGPWRIRVVLGHRADDLAGLVRDGGAEAVANPDFPQGMFSSVCAGVRGLDPAAEAFFLLPVDIPLVRPATFRRLAAAWRQRPDGTLHPTFGGRRGHPPLIPSALIPAILAHSGDGGLRAVLAHHDDRARDVPVADENILFDLDRPEDYENARRPWARRDDPSPAECEAVLRAVHPVSDEIARHGRCVRQAALALGRALKQAGSGVDLERTAAAALLHDVAKGSPDHARVGGRMLAELGFAAVAKIVAAHTDLPSAERDPPREAALVYLADKLTHGDRPADFEPRFAARLRRHADRPEVCAAVRRRREAARSVQRAVENAAHQPLGEILQEAGIQIEGHGP